LVSSNYLLALPILVALYLLSQSQITRLCLLLLGGVITLWSDGWTNFLLILLLLVVTWWGGLVIQRHFPGNRKALGLLIALEISPLLLHKFLKAGLWGLVDPAWLEAQGLSGWLPPLGLSVMTFQAVSYTVDRYRRQLDTGAWPHYAVYMSFFPHLAAGPILRASDFVNQLVKRSDVSSDDIREGLWRIVRGLAKKLILSDVIAKAGVDPIFTDPASFSSLEIQIALLAYTFQIYLDFSGYTDVVIGSARLLGLRLPENFNRPYHASSIAEYWRRWHMSLSAWVTQYVYYPLGGSRVERWKIYRNVMISILLLAVWHGVTLNFLLYGLLHGTAVCVNRWLRFQSWWQAWTVTHEKRIQIAGWLVTFSFVVIARILFKTPTLDDAAAFAGYLLESELSGSPRFSIMFWVCLTVGIVSCFAPAWVTEATRTTFKRQHPFIQGFIFGVVLLTGAYLSGGQALNFIYRNF
jgi:D-alanyl-lipoteichoic acid acyltransferase DltB (MBOAT superfamily)